MLVGRERELGRIVELIRLAGTGCGAVAVVEGPAGIGKTALLDEAANRAADANFLVLRATGAQLEREYAFGVVRQLFALSVARSASSKLLGGAAALAAGPLGLADSTGRRAAGWGDRSFAAMHGLYWLTVNLAERASLLLVLDDAHWADEMSLGFVLYLARRVEELPVLVLVAARPPGDPGEAEVIAQLGVVPRLVWLRPAPLSDAEVARLIEGRGLGGAEREFVMACHQASGGNPFLLGELLAALAAEGACGTAADAARVAGFAPESIVRWVLARLVAQGEDAKQLASAFAVLDAGALSDAALLAGLEPRVAAGAADALIAAHILSAERPYEFVHPLVQAAVYEALAPAARADAHSRAARLMAERGAPSARVAAHVLVAEPAHDLWVVEVLRGAAREASVAGSPGSAASYLERALAETPPREVRAELLLELGEAELQAGLPGAARHMREALDVHPDPRRRAEISLTLGRALFSTGDYSAAAGAFRLGLDEVKDGDDDLSLELRGWYVTLARSDAGLPAVAAERLRELLDDDAPGSTRTERLLLVQFAYGYALSGDQPREEVVRLARRALADGALLEDPGADTGPYGAACYALLFAGEPDAAIVEINRAIDLARRRGSRVAFGWLSLVRAGAYYFRGNLMQALADLHSTSDEYTDQYALDLPQTRALIALCLLDRDDLPGAMDAVRLPGDHGRWMPQPSFNSYLYALGRLKAAQGQLRDALDTLLECGRRVVEMNRPNPAANFPWRSEAALLAARLGEHERARELIAENVALARAFGARHALGLALQASGLIETGEEGLALLAEAVSVLDGSGIELELGRTLTDYGAALRRAGHRRAAVEPLRRGLDLAAQCGALRLEARGREELIAAGARPRRFRIRGADALTASELRVARMAAGGMTNREIAQALFVTIRTVTTHLGHVYQKLEISGREQLSQALDADATTPLKAG